MAPRIFISYRTADGADKATALARDLGRVFGDALVFLDKDDLRGGSRWAHEISRTLATRPVLLLLVTPQLLGAEGADGRRRIDDPADPVRREVEIALAAGAELIPVLCDGVDAVPAAPDLPPPFDHLAGRTWRRLRAYDWAADVRRLVADLHAAGIDAPRRAPRRRVLAAGAALAIVAAAAAVSAWQAWRGRRPASLGGPWLARLGDDPETRFELQHTGERLQLESHPIDIRGRADWAELRAYWRSRGYGELDTLRYRGEGTARTPAGSPLEIDVGWKLLSVPGDVVVDTGNLSAQLADDGRLRGTYWRNGLQAEQPALLERAD